MSKRFQLLFADMRHMGKYFIAAIAIFTAGVVLGVEGHDQYAPFLENQLTVLKQIGSVVQDKANPQLWLFGMIFLNNLLASLLTIVFGLIFAIRPIMLLLVNGMVIGYLGVEQAAEQSLGQFIVGILPHGIIEIPAIFVASAYGIRLGFVALKGVASVFAAPWRSRVKAEFSHVMKLLLPLSIVLALSLFAAALIESTVTYWLVRH
ncbi:stage II sporulation protein M [Paenibacillus chartarius]|uniref:Stage II sporulation protein M n=1 Tax=Paenibacillus chartarius TaxID=747481 RepID=A0ABV6DJF4_9BACL